MFFKNIKHIAINLNKIMNLINLMIIVLIITIEFYHWDVIDNGLIFIKPENLTKTELVEKFKELSSSNSLKDLKNKKSADDKKDENKKDLKHFLKTILSKLSSLILKYKNFIGLIHKITLFTILIRFLKKFKLLGFVFRIIHYIFLSILGIFISDVYGLKELVAEIENYWMGYVNFIHESRIYKIFIRIFYVISDTSESEVIENKREIIEDKIVENKSETLSKLNDSELPSSGRELKNEKIIYDKTSEGNSKENLFKVNKYFWIGLTIISASFIYIYWDSIIELFKSVKPDLGKDEGGSEMAGYPVFRSYQEEYEKYFEEQDVNQELYDLEQIRSHDKGKAVDFSDIEVEKRGLRRMMAKKFIENSRIELHYEFL